MTDLGLILWVVMPFVIVALGYAATRLDRVDNHHKHGPAE